MNPQDGRDTDRSRLGSVTRARERAAAGLPRAAIPPEEPQIARPSALRQPAAGSTSGPPRGPRQQAPFPLQTKDGQISVPISRPAPAPQWPLPTPIVAPGQADGEPSRAPPPGPGMPPQRPPRPSRVPSILDASKVQDHTPVFQYRPRSGRDSTGQEMLAVPETPSSASRPSTLSSVGTISDFPLPAQTTAGPPRRSVNLGPPPSARRGASSFYSNASFVSPIPEESPRTRSHASFASSAAMPDNWGSPSPGPSPDFPDPVYSDTILEESAYGDDDAEESRLVRNASLGKRAKPTLVSASSSRDMDSADRDQRPGPQPIQQPFKDGTGYVENSSSSGTIPLAARLPIGTAVTPDTMLNAYSSASADDPSNPSQGPTPSPNAGAETQNYRRFSAIRRPPRLDIDAVRKAEARGSLTSLPDLIRRATRLAATLEKGRRPASRFDDLDDFPDFGVDREKHRSGLSDMLAAFPPPAHLTATNSRRSIRDSLREQVQSWPLPLNFNRSPNTSQEAVPTSDSPRSDQKRKRRCCGLPLWAFIVVLVTVLIVIAAAVVIPVEFFVIRKQNDNQAQQELQQCREQLTCANGGTNVVSDGVCSCSCIGGFGGRDCTDTSGAGCTTVAPAGSDTSGGITIGDAIPRLLEQAQANFSIPLSTDEVVAKLKAADLSCAAENALVTFNGRATRQSQESLPQEAQALVAPGLANGAIIDGIFYTTITIVLAPLTTFTLSGGAATSFTTSITSGFTTTFAVSEQSPSPTGSATATSRITTTMTMSSGAPAPTGSPGFAVTEDVLDFARVAVLYVLQEDGLPEAETAQVALQRFFSGAGSGSGSAASGGGDSAEAARNVTVGGARSVDLVSFSVDLGDGQGRVGGRGSATVARLRRG